MRVFYVGRLDEVRRIATEGFPLDRPVVVWLNEDTAKDLTKAEELHYLVISLSGLKQSQFRGKRRLLVPPAEVNKGKRRTPVKVLSAKATSTVTAPLFDMGASQERGRAH